MPSTNIAMLQTVANGLGELNEKMVFVGGVVAELYVSDPAAYEIRSTFDVDCVIELSSKMEHAKLEEVLRSKGFEHDISRGAPICRWIYKGIKVDVMPTDPEILGFSNKWYHDGIHNKISRTLPNGTEIYLFSSEYYLASKFDAHNSRGGKDLRQSLDFEDIIYLFDNCSDLKDNIEKSNQKVKSYLKKQCENLINNENITEGIESALPFGSDSDRSEIIYDLIAHIAEL